MSTPSATFVHHVIMNMFHFFRLINYFLFSKGIPVLSGIHKSMVTSTFPLGKLGEGA